MSQTEIIKSKKLSWLNIIDASEKEIAYLKKKFKFNQLDLNDSYSHKHAQRPKLIIRPNYIFIILLFPVFNRSTREIKTAEIDIFVTKDHLITLHYNQLKPFRNFFKSVKESKKERELYLNQSTSMLLYELLDNLYVSIFPMIDHISVNINNVEKNIFEYQPRETVQEVLIIKRNIIHLRRIMQVHKNVLKKIAHSRTPFFNKSGQSTIFFNDLISYTKNIWDLLENHRQTIIALEDTNNALLTFRTNDIMRTLTIFSVIIFPLTLIATLFAIDAKYLPILGSYMDFWKIIGILAVVAVIMLGYFKKKKFI